MKERPILFNGAMVRAILDGRKTQTRRPITTPVLCLCAHQLEQHREHLGYTALGACGRFDRATPSPLGELGDRLWVRETFAPGNQLRCGAPSQRVAYRADLTWGAHWQGGYIRHGFVVDGSGRHPWPADMRGQSIGMSAFGDRWRPSVHMPRWASRITLQVTGVSIERLQRIDEVGAAAEGVEPAPGRRVYPSSRAARTHSYRDGFAALWDSIYARRAPWSSNPMVWVIEFERIEAP